MNYCQQIVSAVGTPALRPSEAQARRWGIALMCLVAVSWVGIEYLGSLISPQYSPFETVWIRYGAHLLFMLVVLGPSEGLRMVRTPRLGRQVFRSFLMLGMPLFFILSLRQGLAPPLVWFITWTSIPIALAMTGILLGERVLAAQWIAAAVGLAGAWLIINPRAAGVSWTLFLPVASAFCFGLYIVLTRQMRTEHTSANLFHTALWVFLPLTLLMPFVWRTPSLKMALLMMAIGLWGFLLLLLLDRALAWAPVSLATPFIYTQSIWGLALGFVMHRTCPDLKGFLGSLLVAGSVGYILARELGFGRCLEVPAKQANPD